MQELFGLPVVMGDGTAKCEAPELTLEENVEKISNAGFQGVSPEWRDREYVKRLSSLLKGSWLARGGIMLPEDGR